MKTKEIERLIRLFFDGDTTPAQEKAICDYFAAHADAGALERYRQMFAWYASLPAPEQVSRPVARRRRLWFAAAGIAAAVAVTVTIGLSLFSPVRGTDSELYAMYRGSYVKQNGKRVTDINSIYEQLCRAEAMADSIETAMSAVDDTYEETIINNALSRISDPNVAEDVRRNILGS